MALRVIANQKNLSHSIARQPFFCPKCDIEIKPVTLVGINVERSPSGEGMFFDKGETEILFRRKLRLRDIRWF